MSNNSHNVKSDRGQTLVLAIVLLTLCSTLMLGLFQVSLVVQEKIRLQLSADMAVLSALNCQANALNSLAIANRAILANDASAGQLNALISETTFYRKLADKFQKLLRFIPYIGPVSNFISTGIYAIEKTIKRSASIILPLAHFSNTALRKSQESILYLLPLCSLQSARSTLKKNTPSAQMTQSSRVLLLKQVRSLQKSISKLDHRNINKLKAQTMDRHTLKRNWRIKLAGMSPIKKTGGTKISSDDLIARDKLRLKVFRRFRWRWKTAISVRSKSSDFGYHSPSNFLTLEHGNEKLAFSFPIMVRSKMPLLMANSPFNKNWLIAVSAGRLTYKRESKPDEGANLFNPFWKAELIPVADEPTARRIIPEVVLKEVRH